MTKIFTPNLSKDAPKPDSVAMTFRTVALMLLVLVAGTLPISLLFYQVVTLSFTKTMIVLLGTLVALLCMCLSVLRTGSLQLRLSIPILSLFAIAGVAIVSALVSGDFDDAIRGDTLEIHTAGFIFVLALVAAVATFFRSSQVMTLRFFQVLLLSVSALGIFHLGRVFFGVDFFSFGLFSSPLFSPLGAWNDLAILFGIAIILSLIAIEQMPLSVIARGVLSGIVLLGLVLLAIVNLVYVWVVVAVVSLIFLMYGLVKDKLNKDADTIMTPSVLSISLNGVVFVCATLFVLAGSSLGGWVSEKTNISYVEVRPSLTATVDIGKQVYETNAFTGIGPNRFADAWRLHKDRTINETAFWNTEFKAGNGYITTWFVTTGVFGMLAWATFLLSYGFLGYRVMVQPSARNRFWYFVGSASFITSAFVWGISLVYVPGAALLLLAAFMTGLTVAASSVLLPSRLEHTLELADRKTGFLLIAGVLIIMIGSIGILYETGRQYASVYAYGTALSDTELTRQQALAGINDAFVLYPNDIYIRQLGRTETDRVAQLAQVPEPTDEQIVQYQTSVENAITALRQAVQIDATQPLNWGYLGQLLLIIANSDQSTRDVALEQARTAVENAKQYDPLNPEYHLLEAQIAVQSGDAAAARASAEEAVRLKRNFTAGLNFLAQLDISAGNTEAAIDTVRAIIQLEPNNPARYYQLGILRSALGDTEGVITAMEAAVARDTEYANARYILALAYIEQDRLDDAVEQLEIVRDLNPDNSNVQTLIDQIAAGEVTATTTTSVSEVSDPNRVQVSEDGVTTTSEQPDTNLIVPVNPVPTEAEELTVPETEETQPAAGTESVETE